MCAPKAGAHLDAFLACGHTDLAGAAVFGCLLHLAGLREGARFWWQFAAGSGSRRTSAAAYCLFLDHSRRGEHHDARHWARELGRRGFRRAADGICAKSGCARRRPSCATSTSWRTPIWARCRCPGPVSPECWPRSCRLPSRCRWRRCRRRWPRPGRRRVRCATPR
ncbi:hypothetical protein WKI68_08920 [Streptomyces sp. MS1.HAVA.3]|uniref:Uncharacterized protein n=1 Tax=Streptomyces caledonius TaxID=3134107 RepID=A0ABU8U104_9ACTN